MEQEEDTEKLDEAGRIEEPEKYEEPEISYELESFGNYLELLYREGRRTELDDRIISEMADREKAAALAEMSPLLEHLRMKAAGRSCPPWIGKRRMRKRIRRYGMVM